MTRTSQILCLAKTALYAGLLACAAPSLAQVYPLKPIHLILPYTAGSGTDVMARTLATELQKELGGTIVIDNKPGANGSISAELLAKARLSMAHGNATGQVAGAQLIHATKFEALSVPYKSTPPALVDLVGGQVDFIFVDIASSQGLMKEGRVRAIAMMSEKRSTQMPDLPSLGERFPGFSFVAWGDLLGLAGMPQPVVDRLQAATLKVMESSAMRERLESLGLEPYPASPGSFTNSCSSCWRYGARASSKPACNPSNNV